VSLAPSAEPADPAELRAVGAELMAAVSSGDAARLRAVYAEDVRIWHTFDGLEQDREQNVRTLLWMHEHVSGVRYEDVRIAATEDGFVLQHVMRADEPAFEAPCMARAWVAGGRITRLEEYVDSAHTRPLTEHIARVRAARAGRVDRADRR
jgi:ketosteroid isomerase-like protein